MTTDCQEPKVVEGEREDVTADTPATPEITNDKSSTKEDEARVILWSEKYPSQITRISHYPAEKRPSQHYQQRLQAMDNAVMKTKNVSTVAVVGANKFALENEKGVRRHGTAEGEQNAWTDTSPNPHDSGILDTIAPLPSLGRQTGLPRSTPGAFPVGSASASDVVVSDRSLVFGTIDPPPPVRTRSAPEILSLNPPSSELVQARAIEESSRSFARALPWQSGGQSTTPERKRKIKIILAIVVCLVVVVVVVIVSSVLGTRRTESAKGTEDATGPVFDTLAPTPYVLDLPSYTLEALAQDKNGTSPQHVAYQWLLNDPFLEEYSPERRLQRYALAVFYYAMGGGGWQNRGVSASVASHGNHSRYLRSTRKLQPDPNGPKPWNPLYDSRCSHGWNDSDINLLRDSCEGAQVFVGDGLLWLEYNKNVSECQWYNQNEMEAMEACNDHKEITTLNLKDNGLEGRLPKEVALLSSLQTLILDKNTISGTLPVEWFTNMKHMKNLVVMFGRITGTIPTEIGLWNENFRVLRILGSMLTGTVPSEMYSLSNLQKLNLVGNRLTGTLPPDLLPGLSSMDHLELVHNRFHGTIPTEIGLLSQLRIFGMAKNSFSGTIPTQIGLLESLVFLHAGNTDLQGEIPSEIGLTALDYTFSVKGSSQISGTIPAELAQKNISNLYFQDTGISGTIPNSWCNASKILIFDCSDTLCGCDCPCR